MENLFAIPLKQATFGGWKDISVSVNHTGGQYKNSSKELLYAFVCCETW